MGKKLLKNIEWGILACSLILLCIGFIALFSSTKDAGYDEFRKQAIWTAISIPIMIIVILVDYNTITKISPVLYGLAIVALIAVLFTEPIHGARSWFKITETNTIQPSEFAKVILIIFLAYIITKLQSGEKTEINKFWKLGIICVSAGVPIVLIALEPDYGTLMAFVVGIAFMLFASGIDKKYVIAVLLIIVIALPLMYHFVLPNHAKQRIDVFMNPELDPRGSGYNLIQSKIAIGSGKMFGMGILMGNQTQLRISLS
ncbi:MAG: FtsW/RodA/SpoVE family cell cycle protein [Clostridia bacterium]|jgi:rod shape determining protein RodA|nr:FtsW/RodA/SpoVE family cell cycle protein [Clostridia bacterium]